nr:ATP-binding cassette domain-containing protein [candidate division Zixibacteria bacterium]
MTLIAGENISRQFEDRLLFNDLSFSVNETDRIGLVGPNGIGKTTLFEIMAGRMRPDSGQITRAKHCRIAYVEQEFESHRDKTLFDFVCDARADLIAMRAEIESLSRRLSDSPDDNDLLEKLGELQHRFEVAGGYKLEAEIKIVLVGLGFPENRFHNRLSDFSGGEKNRAALARVLAGQSNLLLLDEPTNHLDLDSTIWLEEYLKNLDRAYIIVSHDRTFLSNTIEKVWEISARKINQYFNGFDKYLIERRERIDQLHHQYRHQQEEIKRIEDFIRRNMAGQKTKQAQSRQKYLSRIKRIELPQSEYIAPSFSVASGQRSFNLVLAVDSASFGYGNHAVIREVDLNLYRSDRLALIGANGTGKTTFLKSILGELEPLEGSIKIGQKVDPAYFDQELADLDESNTVLDEIWMVEPTAEAGALRYYLARFGFSGEDVFKKISVLSGGEKTKLALAKLLFKPTNFLILDEPTNHLDIDSRLALEEALRDFDGTLLIVSHDRYFLDQVADRIAAIESGRIRIFNGNYSYYRGKKKAEKEITVKKTTDPERLRQYADFKKISQTKGRLKKELRSTMSKIQDHEKTLEKLEKDILYNIPKSDWQKLAEVSRQKSEIEETLIKLYNNLEELEKLNDQYSDSDRQSD